MTNWGADNPPSIVKYSGKNREAELTRSDSDQERLGLLAMAHRPCRSRFGSRAKGEDSEKGGDVCLREKDLRNEKACSLRELPQ